MMEFKYDPERYERIKSKAERVRTQIRALIDQGVISNTSYMIQSIDSGFLQMLLLTLMSINTGEIMSQEYSI